MMAFATLAVCPAWSSAQDDESPYQRGMSAVRFQDFDRAVVWFTEAIRRDPTDTNAMRERGYAFARNEKFAFALADLNRALALDPNDWQALCDRANTRLYLGDTRSARADADAAFRMAPDSARTYACRARILWAQGDMKAALADADQAVRLDRCYPLAHFARGVVHFSAGEYQLALADIDEALKLDPSDAFFWNGRAGVFAAQGRWQDALRDLHSAGRLCRGSELGEVLANRAECFYQMKRLDEALAASDLAVRRFPQNAAAYRTRAKVLDDKGDSAAAQRDLATASRLDPTDPWAPNILGECHIGQNRPKAALELFNRAIAISPDFSVAVGNRGKARAMLGNLDGALADLTQASVLAPNDPDWHQARARIFTVRGDWKAALTCWNEAIRLEPKNAEYIEYRAGCLTSLGRFASAVSDWKRVAELRPDAAEPLCYLAKLLATCTDDLVRNGPEAVRYATRACELTGWKEANTIGALATAYAEAGDFDAAVRWHSKLFEYPNIADEDLILLQRVLKLYEARRPIRTGADGRPIFPEPAAR
jgi:tetratricopeptide (TPR) repeat protein